MLDSSRRNCSARARSLVLVSWDRHTSSWKACSSLMRYMRMRTPLACSITARASVRLTGKRGCVRCAVASGRYQAPSEQGIEGGRRYRSPHYDRPPVDGPCDLGIPTNKGCTSLAPRRLLEYAGHRVDHRDFVLPGACAVAVVGVGVVSSAGTTHMIVTSTGGFFDPSRTVVKRNQVPTMIVLGIILLLVGFIFGIPILWTIGIVVLVIGLVLLLLGSTGRAIGGRRHWY